MASVTSSGKEIATATQRQQRNQHQLGPSSSSASVGQQPEDESRKKNTDCVYFLASPLTCKKGGECEYRHSEYARVNPRDCFFWLNGNCLNPKCAFRHPPLDGLLGSQAAGTALPSLPPPQPVPSSAYNHAKQVVPCIFFQKGYCMKGDKCQFVHGPTASGAKVPQVRTAVGVTEPANFKKAFGLEKCSQQKMLQQVNAAKTVVIPNLLKASGNVPSAFPVNGILAEKGDPQSNNGYIEEHPIPRVSAALDYHGNLKSNSSIGHHYIPVDDPSFQVDKDAEESLRESSPGFDVLVDDQHGDTEYYHNEDQLTGLGSHDGRNLDDYEFGHPDYYNPDADADQDSFHDRQGYDSFDHKQQSYGYEHSRASSERSMREAAHFNRRGLLKTETSDRIRESDLRNHLKQRKVGSLRSVVSTDYAQTSCVEDQGYKSTGGDMQHSPPLENLHRSRLQGRLRVPRSSPINGNGVYKEKETNRGLNWGRLLPSKPEFLPQKGRLRDRLGRRIQDDTWGNFAAPKSLAELRVFKQAHGKEQEQHVKPQSTAGGKRKLLDSFQQGGGDLSFEGPKPLSEILKRKKRAEASASGDQRENNVELKEPGTKCHFSAPDNKENNKQAPSSVSSAPEQHVNVQALNKGRNNHVSEGSNAKHSDSGNKLTSTAASASEADEHGIPKIEEGLIDGEDEYHEGANGEYEYEEGEGDYEYEGDVEGYEGEDVDGGEYYVEEDDGDNFAKKIGVVPS